MKISTLVLLMLFSIPASAIDLVTLNGQQESVHSLQRNNMWTLVMLWSLDCVACEQQKPMIDSFHRDHSKSNAQVVAVSTDGDQAMDEVSEFLKPSSYAFDNYLSVTDLFSDQYLKETESSFKGTPTYLLYGPDGALVGMHEGVLQRAQLEEIVGPAETLVNPSADLMR